MKERLKQAYIQNYRAQIDEKSQKFLKKLEPLEVYTKKCISDFERWHMKGKYYKVALKRQDIDELEGNLGRFDTAF
jgi:cobalamin-dependent methionine synthase I